MHLPGALLLLLLLVVLLLVLLVVVIITMQATTVDMVAQHKPLAAATLTLTDRGKARTGRAGASSSPVPRSRV